MVIAWGLLTSALVVALAAALAATKLVVRRQVGEPGEVELQGLPGEHLGWRVVTQ